MNGSKHRALVSFAAVLLVLGIAQLAAAEVIDYTSCTVTAASDWARRGAIHTIDGTGMTPIEGDLGAVHAGTSNPNDIAWHTTVGGIVEHAWLIVDLGGSYNADSINLWNYNHEGGYESETPAGELARGVKEFNLWIRNDGTVGGNIDLSGAAFDTTGWTQIGGTNTLQPGTGFDDYAGELFSIAGNATHVAIETLSCHEGTEVVYDVEGTPTTFTLHDPYGPIVGLSEVRVFGEAVPEPSTLVLLMLAGCMGLFKRAR